MKKLKRNRMAFLLLPLIFTFLHQKTTAQEDSVNSKELVKLQYYNDNNNLQYLVLENLLKTGKKTEPLANKAFQLYLDSIKAENLIAAVSTDKNGKAKSFLNASLKTAWGANSQHIFLAVPVGNDEEIAAELEITKARIEIDTASNDGVRNIIVQVRKFENNEWVPANDVEMKIGIQRFGGILNAADEETYTTDLSGTITVELNKDSLPGDVRGNIILAAKVEDNDQYGNLVVEKTVPWGIALKAENDFFKQRTLWATRFRTPVWLLIMAYSIIIGVWGTIIYLILQIVKIKKLGAPGSPKDSTPDLLLDPSATVISIIGKE